MKKPLPIEFKVNGRRYEVKSLTDASQTVKGKDKDGFFQIMTLKIGVSKPVVDRLFFGQNEDNNNEKRDHINNGPGHLGANPLTLHNLKNIASLLYPINKKDN